MPTYEYQCKKCGETFELFQSIKDRPLARAQCEACGKPQPVRRLVSAGGAVLFKGPGFYQTDYRSESYKKSQQAESGAGSSKPASEVAKPAEPAAVKPAAESNTLKPKGGSSRPKVAV